MIKIVVGKPIPVPKVEHLWEDMIDVYHRKYMKALRELFENHKQEYDTVGGRAQLLMA